MLRAQWRKTWCRPLIWIGLLLAGFSQVLYVYQSCSKVNTASSRIYSALTSQYMVSWAFLLFIMLLCVDQFSGEKAANMAAMQSVTRNGRRKLYRAKFCVCQLSALLVWSLSNAVYAIALTAAYGYDSIRGVMEAYSSAHSPFAWNTGEFLIVVLSFSLIASQIIAAVIFLMARLGGSTQRSFALISCVLVLPLLIASQSDSVWVRLWLPCLMHSSWLWSGLEIWRFGSVSVEPWLIAAGELVLFFFLAAAALRFFSRQADTLNQKEK